MYLNSFVSLLDEDASLRKSLLLFNFIKFYMIKHFRFHFDDVFD